MAGHFSPTVPNGGDLPHLCCAAADVDHYDAFMEGRLARCLKRGGWIVTPPGATRIISSGASAFRAIVEVRDGRLILKAAGKGRAGPRR